jgi:hypothetical protein
LDTYILEGWDEILTPHVLSEWMVEVCGLYKYRYHVMCLIVWCLSRCSVFCSHY